MKLIRVDTGRTADELTSQTILPVAYGEVVRISINGGDPVTCKVAEGSGCSGCYIYDNIPYGDVVAACPAVKGDNLACVWSTNSSIQFRDLAAMLEDL